MEKGTITKQIWPAIIFLGLYTLFFGLIYPGIVTLINQISFPGKANGCLLYQNGHLLGSKLLGQEFSQPKYFWSRPSATDFPYNPASSSGSNLSPANPTLISNVQNRINALNKAYPSNNGPIPVDLVTASASGLDPHISIAAALYQVNRVANARQIDETVIMDIVKSCVEYRQFGFLGEPRVNVVMLNLKLDKIHSTQNGTTKTGP